MGNEALTIESVPYAGPVVSREEARAAGAKRFFTGQPCPHGHLEQRAVVNRVCLGCKREGQRKRVQGEDYPAYIAAYKARNAERIKASDAEYRARTAEGRAAYNAAYRVRNRDKIKVYNKASYESDPAKFLRRCAASRAKNPTYFHDWCSHNKHALAAHRQNRRARIKGGGGKFTPAEFARLLQRQRFRCVYCSANLRKTGHHADHIVALKLGGSNDIGNIQALCPSCNARKGARDHIEFAQRLGRLL